MATVREVMAELIRHKCTDTLLVLEYLTKERKVISLDDDISKAQWYLQPRFEVKMKEYLDEYKRKKRAG